jgi:antitoxin component YwqK of YwqJK toxin-antitoxin module
MKDKDITPYNENGERHGYWEWYCYNGQLHFKGNYVNGIKDGYWEYYYDNGQLYSKGNYVNGKEDGYWEGYYHNTRLPYKIYNI